MLFGTFGLGLMKPFVVFCVFSTCGLRLGVHSSLNACRLIVFRVGDTLESDAIWNTCFIFG